MMKRTMGFFFCVTMVIMCSVVFASEVYDKPILFRGVEWGSAYKEAVASFDAGITMSKLSDNEYWYTTQDLLYKKNGTSRKGAIGASSNAYSWNISGFKVAGYEVDEVEMLFTYLPGDDGILIKDNEHTALIYAEYKLEPKDSKAAFEDLTTKLTSIYGDVDASQEDGFLIDYHQNMWYGAEGTKVSLVLQEYSSDSQYLFIKYAFDGADTLMDQAYDALVLEEARNAASNIDGL